MNSRRSYAGMLGRIAGFQAAIGQQCREVAEVLCRACHQEVFGQRLAVILAGEVIGEGAGEAAIPEVWEILRRYQYPLRSPVMESPRSASFARGASVFL